jgi:hypothetical protein
VRGHGDQAREEEAGEDEGCEGEVGEGEVGEGEAGQDRRDALRGPLPLTTLTSIPIYGPHEPFGGYDLLATMDKALPQLTALELAGSGMMSFQFEDVEALLESKLVARLRRFELRCEDDSVDAVMDVAIERGLAHVVVHGDMSGRWSWDAATKTLTVPKGVEASRAGVSVVEG